MGNGFVSAVTMTSAGIDMDMVVCGAMIVIGFIMMKKCTARLPVLLGRLMFALGFGMLIWMVLWYAAPLIMAELIYGMRI